MNIIETAKAAGWPVSLLAMLNGTEDLKRLERFAKIIRNQALEDAQVNLIDALITDCEHGVKWLNEKAAQDFKHIYPRLDAAIRAMKEQP